MPKAIKLPDSYTLCNCAMCERVLSSPDSFKAHRRYGRKRPPQVAGRLFDRPYCRSCLNPKSFPLECGRSEGQRAGMRRTRS